MLGMLLMIQNEHDIYTMFNLRSETEHHLSPPGHSLTLNISQTATDTAIVTIEGDLDNRTQAFKWYHFQ